MKNAGLAVLFSSTLLASPAFAQRVDENAVADAEDAFGSSTGGETLGLYSPSNVRGFSPTDAGNLRLEGLYIDRQAEFTGRLVAGNRIRVGPSALGYAFPAPTGIADYRLRRPGETPSMSAAVKLDTFQAMSFELDASMPLGARAGIAGGVGVYANNYASASTAEVLSTALIGVWRMNDVTEIIPFWSRIAISDEEAEPLFIGDGLDAPARIERRQFLGQDWADFEVERLNWGAIARTELAGFNVRAGAFRSANIVEEGYTLLYGAAAPGENAARRVIANPGSRNASTSGELTVSRTIEGEHLRHAISVSIRGREQIRRYGGADTVALPDAPYGLQNFVAPPTFTFGEQTIDEVEQWTAGFAYRGRVQDWGELNLGVLRTDYTKHVTTPDEALPVSQDSPWLFNGSLSVNLSPQFGFYGGFTQGLEESDVAPETAVNRDVAPPALRTRQADAGVQWRMSDTLTLIVGGFEIEKPYYGLDNANLFRALGDVSHRGIEASISGEPTPGLTLIAGALWLDASVRGEDVESGAINSRPVGVSERTFSASVDWRPPYADDWSFDLSVEHRSEQLAHVARDITLPDRTFVDLGVRYRFDAGGAPALLRVQLVNVTDAWAWEAVGSNTFSYVPPRMLSVTLSADF